jgi:hypothetical protein
LFGGSWKCIRVVFDVFECFELFGVSRKCSRVVFDVVECCEVFVECFEVVLGGDW